MISCTTIKCKRPMEVLGTTSMGLTIYLFGGRVADSNSIPKSCCVCHQTKTRSDFGPHKKSPDGLQYECRACVNAKVKAYMLAGGAEYKAKKKAYDKERVAKKRAEISAQNKARYEKERERRIQYAKYWSEQNPDRSRAIKQNYKHRRRAKEASGVKYAELMRWKSAQPKVCHWCGSDCQKSFVVDHYQPLSKGGLHELSNLVIACRRCNARKSAKDPEQFAEELAGSIGQVARNTVTPEMLQ